VPSDLQRLLDEVDSYVSLGFVEDAKEALRDAGPRLRENPRVQQKMEELGLSREAPEEEVEPAAAEVEVSTEEVGVAPSGPLDDLGDLGIGADLPAPAESPSLDLGDEPGISIEEEEVPSPLASLHTEEPEGFPEPPSGGVDLGAELGDELGELFRTHSVEPAAEPSSFTSLGDPGLEDIFKEFRRGVDKQLDKEDYDTRYNLGIAYKEMGLLDEAIAEFQLAAKDESRLLECSSMLGICFMEKGMPKLAVKWFEKGLKAEGRTDEEYQGLRYDLAAALEASGEQDRALELYKELYSENAGFRDVATKLRELRATLG
jgi:hypothetical protein